MNANVLMSSGDEDNWTDVEDVYVDTTDGTGCLKVVGAPVKQDGEDDIVPVLAQYAPGMWMRVTYDD